MKKVKVDINKQKDKYFYIWYCAWFYFLGYLLSNIITTIFGFIIYGILICIIFGLIAGIFVIYKIKNQTQLKEFFNNVYIKINNIWIKIKIPFKYLSLRLLSFYSLIPIILGILLPMFALMVPLYYLSWLFFGGSLSLLNWKLYYFLIPQDDIYLWIIAEIIIFCIGLLIFLMGLITMVIKKSKGVTLIQMGIYKYIRHPQNLGIIILLLPFSLYIPGLDDAGIRMGDIFSWGIFTFFISLLSFFEEWSLMKKYTEKYLNYYLQTGFYLPIFKRKKMVELTSINYYKKGTWLFAYFLIYLILFPFIVQWNSGSLMHFR